MPCTSCEPRHFSLATMCPNGTCMGPVPPGGLPSIGGLDLMGGMQDGTLADSPAHSHFTRSPGLFGRRPTAVFFKRLDYRPKSKNQESPVLEDESFISVTCLAPETLARSAPWLLSPVQGGGRAGQAGTSSGAPATLPA